MRIQPSKDRAQCPPHQDKPGLSRRVYPILTSLLTTLGVGLLLALRQVGLYSHQAFALVLALGLAWAVFSRAWLAYRRRLHTNLFRSESRQHRLQALGRGFFWAVLGVACLAIFPRTGEMSAIIMVIAGIWAGRMIAVLLQPQRLNWGPTIVMILGALVILVDLGRAFAPMSDPVLRLSPPLRGEWIVIQGGQSPLQSHHLSAYNQHFALDLVKLEDGKIFREGTLGNAMVFCWEAPLVAPINGVIEVVRDTMEDSVGLNFTVNQADAAGNHVVIKTDDGLFVMFAHLRHKSIKVKAGERVKVGDALGLIGNSGNTTMSHLHLQVQSHPDFWNPENVSLPFAFGDGDTLSRNARLDFP